MNRSPLAPYLISALVLAGGFLLNLPESFGEKEEHPTKVPLENRTGTCTICARMIEAMPAGEFDRDSHEFSCATCHHPHTRREPEAWKETCMSSGCHIRAWTKTVAHRISPDVFLNCLNCHRPHEWALDELDCRGCHGSLFEESAPVVTAAFGPEFSHDRHAGVECSACHDSSKKHAVSLVTSRQDCQNCHHSATAAVDCMSCHRPPPKRAHSLAIHRTGCAGSGCHGTDFLQASGLSRNLCLTCHQGQADHNPGKNCASCHLVPSADKALKLD